MQRVERLVVQVSESNRLLRQGGIARWRISLMLLDNTAELLLRQECNTRLALNHLGQDYLEVVRARMQGGETERRPSPFAGPGELPRKLADVEKELELQVVTDEKQGEIDGKFVPKVSYLQQNKWRVPGERGYLVLESCCP